MVSLTMSFMRGLNVSAGCTIVARSELPVPIPISCSPALQHPDLGCCTTRSQEITCYNSPFHLCIAPLRPRPIPCSEPSVVGSCLIKHLSLSSFSRLKTRQNSVIILVSVMSVDINVSIWKVMRHRTVNISYTQDGLRKIIHYHDEVLRRFKWLGIN